MRFRQQLFLINNFLENIYPLRESLVNIADTVRLMDPQYYDTELKNIYGTLDNLKKNSDFQENYQNLKKLNYAKDLRELDALFKENQLTEEAIKYFSDFLNDFISKLNAIKKAIDISLPDVAKNSISIKTPEFDSFSDSAVFFSEIEKILKLIYLNDKVNDKDIKFSNFDSGSNWIDIIIPSYAGIKLLNYAIKSAIFHIKEFQEVKVAKYRLELIHTETKVKSEIMEKLSQNINDNTFNHFKAQLQEDTTDFDTSEEYLSKATKGIKLLSTLLEQGTSFEETPNKLNDKNKHMTLSSSEKDLLEKLVIENKQKELFEKEEK